MNVFSNNKPLKSLRDNYLRAVIFLQCLLPDLVRAQGYDPYAYEVDDSASAPLLERLANSSLATLLMVFTGAAGIFLFATASGKGSRGEQKKGMGILCIIAVLILVYYRFTLRNE